MGELRRVERVLQLADFTTEISWGRSDEGDPWCIICPKGSIEVLAHFARFGRIYFGFWETPRCTRTSHCLQELLDDFLNSCSKPVMT